MYLDLAEELIGYGGGDFRAILSQLESLPKDGSMKIGVIIEDSSFQEELLDDRISRENRYTIIDNHYHRSDTIVNDAFTKITKIKGSVDDKESSGVMSIVMDMNVRGEGIPHSLDSMLNEENAPALFQTLKGNLKKDQQGIRRKAFMKIIPQIMFAIFLFGL